MDLTVLDDLKRPKRLRVLRPSGQECSGIEHRGSQARVHLSPALCRRRTRSGVAFDQHVPTRSHRQFATHTRDGVARPVWHPRTDHCGSNRAGNQKVRCGHEPICAQNCGVVYTEMLQVRLHAAEQRFLTTTLDSLDESQLPSLIEILSTLLRDRSPLSVGSVAIAFEAVCPTRLDLLHVHYRRLCRVLIDADEWGQVNLLELLVRYARTMLPRPTSSRDNQEKETEEIDPDLELLLVSAEPLFQSCNPAVSARVP